MSNKKKELLLSQLKNDDYIPTDQEKFEIFLDLPNVTPVQYKNTEMILGMTTDICVLDQFHAVSPNMLARTVETVSGGGLVIALARGVEDVREFGEMKLDEHSRLKTFVYDEVVPRYAERLLLSLLQCKHALVFDKDLEVLPITLSTVKGEKSDAKMGDSVELESLKESLSDTEPFGSLLAQAKTLDQAKSIVTLIYALTEKTIRSTVAVTAARGRGKSAALGIAIAGAVAVGYSNIFVTSPSPENLKTLFEFIFKGFDALGYEEEEDYEIIQSTNPQFKKSVVRINVFKEHRQVIQYISPTDYKQLGQAELLVIDEAAAIPLPHVKNLLGPYVTFLSSTINGYEGTGRSLSLKLISELRERNQREGTKTFNEISMETPIRYSEGDSVELWLNSLLCLDSTSAVPIPNAIPYPDDCELYYVDRDTLFSHHETTETFLHNMMSLYVSSHYKNSPNDLLLMSEAPAHLLFVLLPTLKENATELPDILCVVQVALEGGIDVKTVESYLDKGMKPSGDLIPWNISNQFQDNKFPSLFGARIVRIATHPEFQNSGYGTRALELLVAYFEGKIADISEDIKDSTPAFQREPFEDIIQPRTNLPPLLTKLSDRPPEQLHYLGVSYGLSSGLFKFWEKNDFVPVYIRLTENESTGEHTCIMIRKLDPLYQISFYNDLFLEEYHEDYTSRFAYLLGHSFKDFPLELSLHILTKKRKTEEFGKNSWYFGNQFRPKFSVTRLNNMLSFFDRKRLESFTQNLLDYHAIIDLLPKLAYLFFTDNMIDELDLSPLQSVILVGVGLQKKDLQDISKPLGLKRHQVLSMFMKTIKLFVQYFGSIEEMEEAKDLPDKFSADIVMEPTAKTLDEDLADAADETDQYLAQRQANLINAIADPSFAIVGDNAAWEEALKSKKVPNIVSVKKRKNEEPEAGSEPPKKKRKTSKKKSKSKSKSKK